MQMGQKDRPNGGRIDICLLHPLHRPDAAIDQIGAAVDLNQGGRLGSLPPQGRSARRAQKQQLGMSGRKRDLRPRRRCNRAPDCGGSEGEQDAGRHLECHASILLHEPRPDNARSQGIAGFRLLGIGRCATLLDRADTEQARTEALPAPSPIREWRDVDPTRFAEEIVHLGSPQSFAGWRQIGRSFGMRGDRRSRWSTIS